MKILILALICAFVLQLKSHLLHDSPLLGDHYNGDILLTAEEEEELKINGHTGTINPDRFWGEINGQVIVPFVLEPGYSKSQYSSIRFLFQFY